MTLRVALVSDCLESLEGTETLVVRQAEALRSIGHRVVVVHASPHETPHEYWVQRLRASGVEFAQLGPLDAAVAWRRKNELLIPRVLEFLRAWRPGVVHFVPLAHLAFAWCRSAGPQEFPSLATETGSANPSSFWYDDHDLALVAPLAGIVGLTRRVESNLRSFWGYRGETQAIPPPLAIPPQEARPLDPSQADSVARLGAIGRLRLEKGVEFMLAAVRLLVDELPRISLSVYGRTQDEVRLRQMARAFDITARVNFPGPFRAFDEIDRTVQPHAIFLQPSLFEGLPTALLEVIGRGRVFVGFPVGGIPDLAEDSGAGLVVRLGGTESLARAVRELCGDFDRLREMGRRGVAFVATHNAPRRVAERLASFYRRIS